MPSDKRSSKVITPSSKENAVEGLKPRSPEKIGQQAGQKPLAKKAIPPKRPLTSSQSSSRVSLSGRRPNLRPSSTSEGRASGSTPIAKPAVPSRAPIKTTTLKSETRQQPTKELSVSPTKIPDRNAEERSISPIKSRSKAADEPEVEESLRSEPTENETIKLLENEISLRDAGNSKLLAEAQDLRNLHAHDEEEMEAIKSQHLADIQELRNLHACKEEEMEVIKSQRLADIQELRNSHARKEEEMEAAATAQTENLKLDVGKTCNKLREVETAWSSRLSKHQELLQRKDQEIQDMRDENQDLREGIQSVNAAKDYQQRYSNQRFEIGLKEAASAHERALATAVEDKEQEMEALSVKYEQQFRDLSKAHEQEIEDVNAEHGREWANMNLRHENELLIASQQRQVLQEEVLRHQEAHGNAMGQLYDLQNETLDVEKELRHTISRLTEDVDKAMESCNEYREANRSSERELQETATQSIQEREALVLSCEQTIANIKTEKQAAVEEATALELVLRKLEVEHNQTTERMTSRHRQELQDGVAKEDELQNSHCEENEAAVNEIASLKPTQMEMEANQSTSIFGCAGNLKEFRNTALEHEKESMDLHQQAQDAADEIATLKARLEASELEYSQDNESAISKHKQQLSNQREQQQMAAGETAALMARLEALETKHNEEKNATDNEYAQHLSRIENEKDAAIKETNWSNESRMALESQRSEALQEAASLKQRLEELEARHSNVHIEQHTELRWGMSVLERQHAADAAELAGLRKDIVEESEKREGEWRRRAEFWKRFEEELQDAVNENPLRGGG